MAARGLLHLRPPPPPAASGSRLSARCSPTHRRARPLRAGRAPPAALAYTEPEVALLEALVGVQGRGRAVAPRQLQDVESAVQTLESMEGVPDPRTFVGVDSFKIFQEVYLRTDDPRVTNVVKFSESIGELRVEAEATIKDGKRILFRFDRAAFTFKFLPFKVPYPVPFRLLGDEAKGWLDTTYLSHTGNIRISRGNKGTTFVLQKKAEPRQRLLSAMSSGRGVEEVIDELASNQKEIKVDEGALAGEWQLLWASQSEDQGWSSIASAGLKGLQTLTKDGQLKNSVSLLPGFSLYARGSIAKRSNNNTFDVTMMEGAVQVGGLNFPLDVERKFVIEILYLDSKIRISRLDMHTLVHLRVARTNRT